MDCSEVPIDKSKIILLDDWMISGEQIADKIRSLRARTPMAFHDIEVHTIVTSADRISTGAQFYSPSKTEYLQYVRPILRAYYLAHSADNCLTAPSGAHITGSHSVVDYDFNHTFQEVLDNSDRRHTKLPMIRIRREYTEGFWFRNIDRLNRAQAEMRGLDLQISKLH